MATNQASPDPARQPPAASPNEFEQLAVLVHAFIGMMNAGGIARMDVEHGDLRLSLRAHGAALDGASTSAAPAGRVAAQSPPTPEQPLDDSHLVRAPMIGTFYVAPSPSEPPFVQVGDLVEEGQTIGIIEAMKIMNEIAADRAGTVVELLAENAQTVEYGSPLIRLTPAPAPQDG